MSADEHSFSPLPIGLGPSMGTANIAKLNNQTAPKPSHSRLNTKKNTNDIDKRKMGAVKGMLADAATRTHRGAGGPVTQRASGPVPVIGIGGTPTHAADSHATR